MKKIVSLLVCIVLLATACLSFVSCNSKDYEEAIALLEAGKYEEAKAMFEELGDYKDSKAYLSGFHYVMTGITYQMDGETETIEITLGANNLPARISLQNDEVNNAYVFTFNDIGKIVRNEIFFGDEDSMVTEYIYDANGNMLKSIYHISEDEQSISEYTYDANGNPVKGVTTTGNMVSVTDYTCDANGNILLESCLSEYGNRSTTTYTYNENGKRIKEVHEDPATYSYVIDYTYDANGYLVKEIITDDAGQTVVEYTRDANGNAIKKVSTDAYGNQAVLEVQYKLVYLSFELPEDTEEALNSFLDMI